MVELVNIKLLKTHDLALTGWVRSRSDLKKISANRVAAVLSFSGSGRTLVCKTGPHWLRNPSRVHAGVHRFLAFSRYGLHSVLLANVAIPTGHQQRLIESRLHKSPEGFAIKGKTRLTLICLLFHRCFAFAELPWYQRKMAAVIFATPPTATYEEVMTATLVFFLCVMSIHCKR